MRLRDDGAGQELGAGCALQGSHRMGCMRAWCMGRMAATVTQPALRVAIMRRSHQAVWADADKYQEELEAELELEALEKAEKRQAMKGGGQAGGAEGGEAAPAAEVAVA